MALGVLKNILSSKPFLEGDYTTKFVEENQELLQSKPNMEDVALSIAAKHLSQSNGTTGSSNSMGAKISSKLKNI